MKKRVLTTGEVADYCGVNFRTVIRWIKRGQLDAYQLPGRGDNRIEVDDFIDFLITHKMPVPDELKSVLANKESTPTPSEKEQRIKSGDTVDIKPQEKL